MAQAKKLTFGTAHKLNTEESALSRVSEAVLETTSQPKAKNLLESETTKEVKNVSDFKSTNELITSLTNQLEAALDKAKYQQFFSRAEMLAVFSENVAMHRILIGLFETAKMPVQTHTFSGLGHREVLNHMFGNNEQRGSVDSYRVAATQLVVTHNKLMEQLTAAESALAEEKAVNNKLYEKVKSLEASNSQYHQKIEAVKHDVEDEEQDWSLKDKPSAWFLKNTKQTGKFLGVTSTVKNKGMKTKVESIAKVDIDTDDDGVFLEFGSKENAEEFLAYVIKNASKLDETNGVNKGRIKNYVPWSE